MPSDVSAGDERAPLDREPMPRKQATHTNGSARRPQVTAGDRQKGGHGARTAAVRERAVLALLAERTVTEAAAKAGVGEKTLRRWLSEDEDFKTAYASARQSAYEAGIGRVQMLTSKAVDALEQLLDAKTPANVRLGAARSVVEIGVHQADAETILKTLDAIEADQRQHHGR